MTDFFKYKTYNRTDDGCAANAKRSKQNQFHTNHLT
jgi:hypothetical protein